MSTGPFRVAVHPHAVIWDADLDGSTVPGAHFCAVCDVNHAYVITTADVPTTVWYGHCSLCGHSVFLGTALEDWLPGPEIADVLAAEVRSS